MALSEIAVPNFSSLQYGSKFMLLVHDANQKPWFKANDVTDVLGYANCSKALKDHVDPRYRGKLSFELLQSKVNCHPETEFLTVTGLISLIMNTKKKTAKPFQEWVLETVVPSAYEYKTQMLESEIRHMTRLHGVQPIKPHADDKWSGFLVLRKNCKETPCIRRLCQHDLDYYAVRAERRNLKPALKKLSQRFPQHQIIVDITPASGGIDFYNVMKERRQIIYKGNQFRSKLPERDLTEYIMQISGNVGHDQETIGVKSLNY